MILMADDVSASLWSEIDSGRIDELVPELPALRMEQDPIHRHKDVLSHTVAVVAKTPADLAVRLAALFHDIAKPNTRSFEHGGVTFRHHEAVGRPHDEEAHDGDGLRRVDDRVRVGAGSDVRSVQGLQRW